MLEHAPEFDAAFARRLARDLFGVEGTARALTSERDQNFLIEDSANRRFVLKIANALEDPAMVEAQQQAMMAIGDHIAPAVVRTLDGRTVASAAGERGRTHLVWGIAFLEGVPLARVHERPASLLTQYGECIGALTRALSGFDHPAVRRAFHWDLVTGRALVSEYRGLIADAALGSAIDTLIAQYDRYSAPVLSGLRRSAIHGDLNDHNVLVSRGAVTGVVDFGDMVYSYTVGDLAIAAAYAMLDASDPLGTTAHLVHGFASRFTLTADEIAALFGLSTLRLCMSACVAAHQMRARPDNAYLDISQAAIRRTLPRLARIPFGLATAVFRHAAGLAPVPATDEIVSWLGTQSFAPIIDLSPALALDLGVGSPLLVGDPVASAEETFLTPRINSALGASAARLGIGRYDEPRLLYTEPMFSDGDRRRTIHLGIDLFAPAGTAVHAPLKGTVHAIADNHALQDYGPVVILRHDADTASFYTLYGHLSKQVLSKRRVGDVIEQREIIGAVGTVQENVGWTPHVHVQIITDLLGLDSDFPGVGYAAQREVWRALSPDPSNLCSVETTKAPIKAMTLSARRQRLGRNLSIAYDDPLRIERGWRQYLYDDVGQRYLDAYNNVPHVGHCHPSVVRAALEQMTVLNTNTRYLSDRLTEYAERLLATFPAPLGVCYFLSSASEANELALRLARARTGQRDMIVLDAAYHGNTTTLIDLSPYKHNGPGGAATSPWVHVAPIPDDYRGAYRRGEPDIGHKYADHVAEIAARLRGRLAGFIAETCPSVGGQIMMPDGYLAQVYGAVRAAGGICIADEVQTGLGRIGTHFWAFQAHDVVPDIVVLGKPLGNGHPLAAVVTTPEIADAFNNGMEFFSTFGGNTVSCAVGLAVLDVMRDERLQAHALQVGQRLLTGLGEMALRHEIVGDVRGSGLFLGLELVRNRETREPATAEAGWVANRMRAHGVLLGTDGPYHNVIKIRPPMPFDASNADHLIERLDRILSEPDVSVPSRVS